MTKANIQDDSDLSRWTLVQITRAIKETRVSPVEVVEHLLERIETLSERFNAYITVLPERALATAAHMEKEILAGKVRGPLHGVPVGLKDIIFTKGVRTTMGSAFFKDHIPDYNAAVVDSLEDSGAILLGKLNTHEFAYGPTGDRSYFGPMRNPYDTAKIAGGSSGGSGAAVASGLCYAALGSDTGGSVRIPASCCGIVGMKPTFGRVSKYGVFPLAWTLDHIGPMTRTVEDNAILLNVLAGFDGRDPYSARSTPEDFTRNFGQTIRGAIVGIPRSFYFDSIESEVERKVKEAIEILASLGADVRLIDVPYLDDILNAYRLILASEAYALHRERLVKSPDGYSDEVRERLAAGEVFKGHEYASARQLRKTALKEFNRVFEEAEIIVVPSLPILPTEIGQRQIELQGQEEPVLPTLTRLMGPTNLLGLPSLSIPCGLSASGLPVGLQLIGRQFSEANLYRFGYAFEKESSILSPTFAA